MSHTRTGLRQGWTFVDPDDPSAKPLPVAQFATVIHLHLLAHQLIPDPDKDRNSKLIQWVGEKRWRYSTTFRSDMIEGARSLVVLDGLDTYATIYIDDQEIVKTSNLFL